MRQIVLDGRIGKDGAKKLKTASGKEYIRFSIANDAYIDGTNQTDWFDVTCFDPYIVDKKFEYLKQGRYAIIQGGLKSEIAIRNGKAFLNQYITANTIELPSFGKKDENNEAQVSTYTASTKSETVVTTNVPAQPKVEVAPAQQPAQAQTAPAGWDSGSDDLPF